MSLGLSLLEELVFLSGPMTSSAARLKRACVSLEQSIAVSGSTRKVSWKSPYFTRTLGPSELGAAWEPFCSLMRRHHVPTFSTSQAMDKVPAAAVPARWSGRPFDLPFHYDDLNSADLFEIACYDSSRQHWRWPTEVFPDKLIPERLDSLLRSVRMASGGDTPIGLSLPLGCHIEDMRSCLPCDIDFVSLSCRTASFEANDLHSLVECRRLTQILNRPLLPIIVTAPIRELPQAHKLLALGASSVSLDEILRPLVAAAIRPKEMESTAVNPNLRYRLPTLTPIAVPGAAGGKRIELPQVDELLRTAHQSLTDQLQCMGTVDLSGLEHTQLRSISERASRVTGVARLEQLQ